MFQRFYDVADYPVGWMFNLPPGTKPGSIFTIIKIKTSRWMDSPKYLIVISFFGHEFWKWERAK